MNALRNVLATRDAVDIALRQRVDRLIVTDGALSGIAVGNDAITAKAVVLATGGLGNNPALVAQHYPDGTLSGDWTWYIGAPGARGDGLLLAEEVGAQITGHNAGHCVLRANFSHDLETYMPGWLIVVNHLGERIFNEMGNPYLATEPILIRNGGRVFAIFDEASKKAAKPQSTIGAKKAATSASLQTREDWVEPIIDQMLEVGKIDTADTLVELATRIEVPSETLSLTIATYNRDVERGEDSQFLKRSDVLRPISTPPYYATELRQSMLATTSVGPRVDRDARVLRAGGVPIPGLYAAGECTGGVVGKVYLGAGNSLTNCLVFGRAAGQHAVAPPDR